MIEISLTDLKNKTGLITTSILKGQTILLTRYNRVIAKISPHKQSKKSSSKDDFFGILKSVKIKIPKRSKLERKIKW